MKFLTILLILVMATGCGSNSDIQSDSSDIIEATQPDTSKSILSTKMDTINRDSKEVDSSSDWNSYQNSRYGFKISYPKEWTAGEESDNGDGKILYIGNPDVDIRVYASNYFNDTITETDKLTQYQRLKLDSGVEADMLVGHEDGMYLLEVYWVSKEEIEYHYYVKVSKDFFEKNEQILLKVAKSFEAPE